MFSYDINKNSREFFWSTFLSVKREERGRTNSMCLLLSQSGQLTTMVGKIEPSLWKVTFILLVLPAIFEMSFVTLIKQRDLWSYFDQVFEIFDISTDFPSQVSSSLGSLDSILFIKGPWMFKRDKYDLPNILKFYEKHCQIQNGFNFALNSICISATGARMERDDHSGCSKSNLYFPLQETKLSE